jgi:uncharacterized RDD family membrane protein YckC
MQQTETTLAVAHPLLRIAAFLIDTVIASLISLSILSVVGDTDGLSDPNRVDQNSIAVVIISNAIYTIGFNATKSATLGKIALGMYVADLQSARIRPDTAILRYIVFLVGHTVFVGSVISLVLLFIKPSRRTIHDRLAGTVVLRRPKDTELPPPDLS